MPLRPGESEGTPRGAAPLAAALLAAALCLAAGPAGAREQTRTTSGGPSVPSASSSSSSSSETAPDAAPDEQNPAPPAAPAAPASTPPEPWTLSRDDGTESPSAPNRRPASAWLTRSSRLTLLPDDVSVYEPPAPPRPDEGVNNGAVSFDLNVRYFTDYVYRGVNHNNAFKNDTPVKKSNKLNLQVDASFSFNLGKFPHPFFGLFTNVNDSDPVSRFQEIRPYLGLEWKVRPLILAAGHNSYIYPEREQINTAEVWGRITLDDSYVFKTEKPIFSPYVYGAYDYDKNHGWYFEAGVKHDFVFEDYGLTVTLLADAAYIDGFQQQFIFRNNRDVGFQHYDVGLITNYSLNRLFKFPNRYGDFSVNGYLYYTDGLNNRLKADTQLYGGAGIGFHY